MTERQRRIDANLPLAPAPSFAEDVPTVSFSIHGGHDGEGQRNSCSTSNCRAALCSRQAATATSNRSQWSPGNMPTQNHGYARTGFIHVEAEKWRKK
jgi:hypothetical protein